MSAPYIVQEYAPGPRVRWRRLHTALHHARRVRARIAAGLARVNWGLALATGACAYAWGAGLPLLINAAAKLKGF